MDKKLKATHRNPPAIIDPSHERQAYNEKQRPQTRQGPCHLYGKKDNTSSTIFNGQFTLTSSFSGLLRKVFTGHNNGWKKFRQSFGIRKKSRTERLGYTRSSPGSIDVYTGSKMSKVNSGVASP